MDRTGLQTIARMCKEMQIVKLGDLQAFILDKKPTTLDELYFELVKELAEIQKIKERRGN